MIMCSDNLSSFLNNAECFSVLCEKSRLSDCEVQQLISQMAMERARKRYIRSFAVK